MVVAVVDVGVDAGVGVEVGVDVGVAIVVVVVVGVDVVVVVVVAVGVGVAAGVGVVVVVVVVVVVGVVVDVCAARAVGVDVGGWVVLTDLFPAPPPDTEGRDTGSSSKCGSPRHLWHRYERHDETDDEVTLVCVNDGCGFSKRFGRNPERWREIHAER